MLENIKENWRQFKESQTGHRFQERYYRRQQTTHGRFNLGKLFNILGGIVVAFVGFFLVPAPGPGWGVVFLGLAMLASEFLIVARFLDWAEVKLRGLVRWAKGIWAHSSSGIKILIGLLSLICIAAVIYGAYYLIFSGSNG